MGRVELVAARLLHAQIALATGRPATAAGLLHQAVDFHGFPFCWPYWRLLTLAEALAVSDDAPGAARALTELQAAAFSRLALLLWAPDALLAQAGVAAAGGGLTRAAALARQSDADASIEIACGGGWL